MIHLLAGLNLPELTGLCKSKLATGALVPIFGPLRRVATNPKENRVPMASIASHLPALPGMLSRKTRAGHPVWSGSASDAVRFHPLSKRDAATLYHRARALERRTRRPGRQDGALGRNGLAVLHSLIFDFLDYRSGRLDPGYKALARASCLSVRSVARGLAALKRAGLLHWQRRCEAQRQEDGRFVLVQLTNAYAILPSSQWHGFIDAPPAPLPAPETWGHHPGGDRSGLTEAAVELRDGGCTRTATYLLGTDVGDPLAAALARLGQSLGFDDPARCASLA